MCRSEKVVEDEEDLYDCVYDDEDGGEIYEDLMKTEALPPPVSSFTPSGFTLVFVLCKPVKHRRYRLMLTVVLCLFPVFCECSPSTNRQKSTSGAAV